METLKQEAAQPLARKGQPGWATAMGLRSLSRAVFPKVMEFKVISREREKHEFMPVVYVIERTANWVKRVPRYIEHELIQQYIAPTVVRDEQLQTTTTKPTDPTMEKRWDQPALKSKLATLERELLQRTRLLDPTTGDAEQRLNEAAYKLAVVVDYAKDKPELDGAVRAIATTLRHAADQRALLVPVYLHYCAGGGFLNVQRYAGIRYGAPVLLEPRDIETFQTAPTEFTKHISARLRTSLKMPPPPTAAQMQLLRLSRTLHVYCAKVVRDDCFSRRQIASMNEEILQIHFRTRQHPDMHALKDQMQKYCNTLKKWKLKDEDVNAATFVVDAPTSPVQLAWILASTAQRVASMPWQLLLSGACDIIYRSPSRSMVALAAIAAGLLKCSVAFMLIGVLSRIVLSSEMYWFTVLSLVVLLAMHQSGVFASHQVTQPWKKLQFYIMDSSELRLLKETRMELARKIHAIVARYVSTDMPPPVLQEVTVFAARPHDHYSLNVHHKIFINAPRSLSMRFASEITDPAIARRAIYAPKMLRDETWRQIYATLAPPHLQFSVLLAQNKGDSLPMDQLLQTPLFNAVLTAYEQYQTQSPENEVRPPTAADSSNGAQPGGDDAAYMQSVIEAALQMAREEDERAFE